MGRAQLHGLPLLQFALFVFVTIPFYATPAAAFSPATNVNVPSISYQIARVKRMTSSLSSSSSSLHSWRPGTELLELDPSIICTSNKGGDGTPQPQLAKDEDYASAVLKGWGEEVSKRTSSDAGGSVASPLVYKCENDDASLHGYIYRPYQSSTDSEISSKGKTLPGIILFHTGAGPQDIFLRWKADSLVNERETFGKDGCVVLIADIIGDETGWAWHDREKYGSVRTSVLVPDENGERKKLTDRVQAAIDAIASQPGVDPTRIGAMGFCLGGHPILELARMKIPSVRAMVTFHGVFDGVRKLKLNSVESTQEDDEECNVLVCTGKEDPFIQADDLDAAMKMFNDLGYKSNIMSFERTRHGFTNPAQDYNPSEAFAYSEEAYTEAWSAALSLLSKSLK